MMNYLALIISVVFFAMGLAKCKGLKQGNIILISILTTFFLIYSFFFLVADYFTGKGIDDSVIYHLQYGLDGAGFKEYWFLMLITGVGIIVSIFLPYKTIKRILRSSKSKNEMRWFPFYSFIFVAFFLNPTTRGLFEYYWFETFLGRDTKYNFSEHYRAPGINKISKNENFVIIYAESLERTYFDEAIFPGLIKDLRHFESIATYFTNIEQVFGTQWTIGGIVASQCGLPLVTTSHGNSMSGMKGFLQNATCLGDLLSNEGYKLVYLNGSSVSFSGIDKFLFTHGYNEVYGQSTLKESLVNKNYQNEWGLYDDSLFEIAFNELETLSKQNAPFGLVISTMDTHPPNGHTSAKCKGIQYKDGSNPILNAVACSDHVIGEFVNKILNSNQKENTTIVIMSDHLSMPNTASYLLNPMNRRNLFLIISPTHKKNEVNKKGSMLDIAPTLIPFLGYEGNIALGRNLLKDEESLVSKIPDFNITLKTWKKYLMNFWGFPKVENNDEFLIDPNKKSVSVQHNVFSYPLLVEFDDNMEKNIVIKFDFGAEEGQKLIDQVSDLKPGKLFLWVDLCESMYSGKNSFKDEYCVMYGRAVTKEVTRIGLHEITVVPVKNIYNKKTKHINNYDVERFIAHAGGEINGEKYTDSLEALDHSYEMGFRLFELDIIKTSDDIYVAAHDWTHWKKLTGYSGEMPPTRAAFKQQKIKQRYTPLDIDDINDWFKKHSDAILVTDKINSPLDFSSQFIDKDRLIMELFTLDAIKEAQQAKIKSPMLNWDILYGLPGNKVQALVNMGITHIAASRRVIEENRHLINNLKANGIKVFVFHVNFDQGKDEAYVVCNEMDYIFGLYADKFNFHQPLDCSRH